MKKKPLCILAPTRYPWTFNSPRHSRHHIVRRAFLPMDKIIDRYQGLTVLNPFPLKRFDLLHAFNRIPLGRLPFVIGFESHLPRAYGREETGYYKRLAGLLASDRCRRIIAISQHAKRNFLSAHGAGEFGAILAEKIDVRYPNIDISAVEPREPLGKTDSIRISFVGNHFARKGGCVAVRIAEIARQKKLPLELVVVSSMETGAATWTDPLNSSFMDRYIKLLNAPNVTHRRNIDNFAVGEIMAESDLSILTTFSDTFGFSAIEAMARSTPVIGTRQSALMEFIDDGENGSLLDLPIDASGDWIYSASRERGSSWFEKMFHDEVERMAIRSFEIIERLHSDRDKMQKMRRAARATAVRLFDSRNATQYWDELYEAAADHVVVGRSGFVGPAS
jgi:glycosyltransferase involved in cell wall biosynthesis